MVARMFSVAIVFVAVLAQVTLVERLRLGGAAPDLVVLSIVSIALLTNSATGAVHGFLGGMFLSLSVALPLGPQALLGTLVGYWAGRQGEVLVTDMHPVPPLLIGVLATGFLGLGRPVVEFLVDPTGAELAIAWTSLLVGMLLNALLAVPIYLAIRHVMAFAPTTPALSAVDA